jgi:hypothetical protein
MSDAKRNRRVQRLVLLSWLAFAAGLLVQGLAPRLTIENRAFVISLPADGAGIRPAEIIASERRMQLISAILTLSGALGLAYGYGGALIRRA